MMLELPLDCDDRSAEAADTGGQGIGAARAELFGTTILKRLGRDIRAIGAAEFALIAPVLISFVIGIAQVGKLYYANADMKNAVAAGARVASVWPVPGDSTIEAAVNARISRTNGLSGAKVVLTRGKDGGNDFVDIQMDTQVPLDFIFFKVGPVTLRETRKVYLQMDGVLPPPPPPSASPPPSSPPPSSPPPSSPPPSSPPPASPPPASPPPSSPPPPPPPGNGNGKGHGHGNCAHCD
jgi:hypothetical protein